MHKLRCLVEGSEFYLGKGNAEYDRTADTLQVDAVGWAWAPSFLDLNNDGWLDLYACSGFISQDRSKPDG